MKLTTLRKIFITITTTMFTYFSIGSVYAVDSAESNDPIADISANNVTPTVPAAAKSANVSNDDNADDAKSLSKQSQDAIANMLLQSVSLMGIAYKWGGNTPDAGLDCSGFVRYVYQRSLGINLPRTAAEQARVGKRISIDNLEPGDLIFFNTRRGSNTHVGIYLGNNKFIQSPRTGQNIQITDLSGSWRKNFNGAKRIVQEKMDDSGNVDVQNLQGIRDEALPVAHRKLAGKRSSRRGRGHSTHQRAKSVHSKNKATKSTQTSNGSKKSTKSKSKKKS